MPQASVAEPVQKANRASARNGNIINHIFFGDNRQRPVSLKQESRRQPGTPGGSHAAARRLSRSVIRWTLLSRSPLDLFLKSRKRARLCMSRIRTGNHITKAVPNPPDGNGLGKFYAGWDICASSAQQKGGPSPDRPFFRPQAALRILPSPAPPQRPEPPARRRRRGRAWCRVPARRMSSGDAPRRRPRPGGRR